ncbi:MAG: hypothetical protein LBT08_02220 [Synergistaceae bacterium]|nr:hypothetical protein [Synergistaceae bacterium]
MTVITVLEFLASEEHWRAIDEVCLVCFSPASADLCRMALTKAKRP